MLRSGVDINDTFGTQLWLESMQEARFPQRPEGSQTTTGIVKPIHDQTSHHRSATEYFAVNYGSIKKKDNAPVVQEEPVLDPYDQPSSGYERL